MSVRNSASSTACNSSSGQPSSQSPKKADVQGSVPRLIYLALALATLAVYCQVRGFDFVSYDDHWIIRDNPHLQHGLSWSNLAWAFTDCKYDWWHPLTWLSHMVDCELYGLNPGPHHWTNLLLHVANVLLLFGLLHRMTGTVWRSGFVSALFALHPLHVESVAWITERKDVLSTCFLMLTLLAYDQYIRQPCLRRYLLVLLAFGLALMSKPMMVTLPFALMLLDYWPLGRFDKMSRTRLALEKVPLLVVAVISSVITLIGQKNVGGMAHWEACPLSIRISNAMVSYLSYLRKMVWPNDLAFFYPYCNQIPLAKVAGAAVLLLAITAAVIRVSRRHPYLLVGWLWYLGTL